MEHSRHIGRTVLAAVVSLLFVGALVGFVGMGGDSANDVASVQDAGGSLDSSAVTDEVGSALSDGGAMTSKTAAGSSAGPATTLAPNADSAAGAGRASPAPTGTGGAGAPLPPTDQKIVKNGTVRLEIKEGGFRSAFAAASRVASAHGGFVVSSEASTEKDKESRGTLTLRVPSAAFDAVRADLAALGEVKDEHLTGQDVGGQLVDLDARIRSLQVQEDALRQLMAKARTIGETVEVQGHLTQVRQQIEQLSGEKARLTDAAALATLKVELAEPGAAKAEPKPKPEPSMLAEAWDTAVEGALTVMAGTIIVLGWLLPLGVLFLLGWLAYRPIRQRRPLAPEPAAVTAD